MNCSRYRELISAFVDAELGPGQTEAIQHHVSTCAGCESFLNSGFSLKRYMTIFDAGGIGPTKSPTSGSRISALYGASRIQELVRYVLIVVGSSLVILAAPEILAQDVSSHAARHSGVFAASLGVAFLAVAARPHRAIGLLPLTGCAALLMTVAGLIDLIGSATSLLSEAIHGLEFIGLGCVWLISGGWNRLLQRLAALTANFQPITHPPDARRAR